MRTTALSALVLLGASLVASAPIRVVVTTHQEVSANGHYAAHNLPPLPGLDDARLAAMHMPHLDIFGMPVAHDAKQTAPGRAPCGAMRAKAQSTMDRFRAMFGLTPVAVAAPHTPGHAHQDADGNADDFVHILPHPLHAELRPGKDGAGPLKALAEPPILPFVGTPVRPAFALEPVPEEGWAVGRPAHAHAFHRFHRHHGSFLRRVHHALMALGPWEGRAVAFVLGCGIGVLLRMMWVMVLITARAIRGPSQEDREEDGYDVVFDDEAELLVPPPQYTVLAGSEAVPAAAADEKEKV